MGNFTLEDSGARRQFDTGSMRDVDTDKPRYDLIPPEGLYRLAMLYTRGAKKYEPRNWEKGQPCSVVLASLMRHVEKYRQGDRTEDHLAAVAWNAFALMTFEDRVEKGELPASLLDAGASIKVREEHAAKTAYMDIVLNEMLKLLVEGDGWAFSTREFFVLANDLWPAYLGAATEADVEAALYNDDRFSLDEHGRWIAS